MDSLQTLRRHLATLRRPLSILVTGLLLGFTSQANADEVYRWVDENGVVNYTQLKPKDADVETISTESGGSRVADDAVVAPTPVTSVATGESMSPEQEKMLEGLKAAEQARQDEIARIKSENCQQSRDVLNRLTVKDRIRIRGADGEYRIMGEDERQDRISKAQENIALFCVS
ncbi:MAG: DUF4124 domain-containing protein [Pseudomonadota bacterium]